MVCYVCVFVHVVAHAVVVGVMLLLMLLLMLLMLLLLVVLCCYSKAKRWCRLPVTEINDLRREAETDSKCKRLLEFLTVFSNSSLRSDSEEGGDEEEQGDGVDDGGGSESDMDSEPEAAAPVKSSEDAELWSLLLRVMMESSRDKTPPFQVRWSLPLVD